MCNLFFGGDTVCSTLICNIFCVQIFESVQKSVWERDLIECRRFRVKIPSFVSVCGSRFDHHHCHHCTNGLLNIYSIKFHFLCLHQSFVGFHTIISIYVCIFSNFVQFIEKEKPLNWNSFSSSVYILPDFRWLMRRLISQCNHVALSFGSIILCTCTSISIYIYLFVICELRLNLHIYFSISCVWWRP